MMSQMLNLMADNCHDFIDRLRFTGHNFHDNLGISSGTCWQRPSAAMDDFIGHQMRVGHKLAGPRRPMRCFQTATIRRSELMACAAKACMKHSVKSLA